MSRRVLTDKQIQAAEIILQHAAVNQRTTVRDLARELGCSHTTAHRRFVALQHAGYIEREPRRRSFEVSMPDANSFVESEGLKRGIRALSRGAWHVPGIVLESELTRVAMLSELIPEHSLTSLWLPVGLFSELGSPEVLTGLKQVVVFRMYDDSMKSAGILNGDYVVVPWNRRYKDNDTVLVWYKKRLLVRNIWKTSYRVRLNPQNSKLEPIITTPRLIDVIGKVVGVIRSSKPFLGVKKGSDQFDPQDPLVGVMKGR